MDNITRPSASPPRVLLTIRDAGVVAGIGRTKLYNLLREGSIAAVKVGRRTLVPYEEIQRWAASLPSTAGQGNARRGGRGA